MRKTDRPPAVIFDRDGTLASVAYIAPTDKDTGSWAAFNASLRFDAPVPVVVALLRSIRPGVTRIMTSGRMAGDHPGDLRRRWAMEDWIAKYDLPIDALFMRAGGDTRRDSVVKEEMLHRNILPFFDVKTVIDDREQVCEMWERNGLHVIRVVDPNIAPPISLQGETL